MDNRSGGDAMRFGDSFRVALGSGEDDGCGHGGCEHGGCEHTGCGHGGCGHDISALFLLEVKRSYYCGFC